ncbi:flagellar filament capping protein FliD [Lachnospiraceae bacterium 62-26]
MATVGGLTTSTSTSIRGYGGLASGLDRDTLIEGMTSGTTSKITQQQKKQQQLEWKQAAIQSITSKLLDFSNKYTSWSSSTNLFSSMLWGRNKITTTGENSKYVSVSGSGSSAGNVKIMGVKQLAEKAKLSTESVSSGILTSGVIDVTSTNETVQNLVGKTLSFKFGNETYDITLSATDKDGKALKYDTMDNAVESINKLLKEESAEIAGSGGSTSNVTLDEIIKVTNDNGNIKFEKGDKSGGNSLTLKGGSALEVFGVENKEYDLAANEVVTGKTGEGGLNRPVTFAEKISGKELTFSYNGKSKTVYMPDLSNTADSEKLATIKESLQNQLDEAFGKGRIEVDIDDAEGDGKGKLTFRTTLPGSEKKDDKSSTLQIMSGSSDLIGDSGVLKMQPGASNHLNLYAKISESGLKGLTDSTKIPGEIWINDTRIEITASDTLNSLMDKINKNTDVNISYLAATDKFTFTSKDSGASGTIKFGKTFTQDELEEIGKAAGENAIAEAEKKAAEEGKTLEESLMDEVRTIGGNNAVAEALKDGKAYTDEELEKIRSDGAKKAEEAIKNAATGAGKTVDQHFRDNITTMASEDAIKSAEGSNELLNSIFGAGTTGKTVAGTDAIVAVKFAGSDEVVELVRDSNSFTADGLTINVTGKFGYTSDTQDPNTLDEADAVGINAQVDADSIVDAVKGMIEEYNSIIEMVNKEVKTKPDRDYEPLTSEQKKELSEDEIEAWEKKAKEGLLYADSDIRSLTSDLRFIIDGGIAQELAEMGISTSSSYSDNGKINFDESKFRAALSSNPERVQELFAESSVKNTNGNGYSKGIGANLKSVLDKYVNTTGAMTSKGILIRKAGHESSPMSVTENTMYSQLKDIKERIASLQERLETERDRYIKQFTSLETLISQMNNQSSWLSQFGG